MTPTGDLDPGFGLAGVCRQDGLGDASLAAVDRSGRLWSAGVAKTPPDRDRCRPGAGIVAVSRMSSNGELESGFGTYGIATSQLQLPSQDYEANSLVSLAGGRAIISGTYSGTQSGGSWLARLTPAGRLDTMFGSAGLVTFPARDVRIAAELADGSLQGWEKHGSSQSLLRLASDGTPAPGFGTTGTKPIAKPGVSLPSRIEPTGEWFGLVVGSHTGVDWTIGLVRCRPDGTIDDAFGAGAISTGGLQLHPIEDVSVSRSHYSVRNGRGKVGRTASDAAPARRVLPHPLDHRVAGNVPVLGSTRRRRADKPGGPGLVMLAWTAAGLPRATWNGKPARAIANPGRSGTPSSNWLGWKFRCALLQSDGSIIAGLAGDDEGAMPDNQSRRLIRSSAYFCRLLPPAYDLDPAFGGGHVVRRLPGEDQQIPGGSKLVDYQLPAGLQSLVDGTVVAGIRCGTGTHPPIAVISSSHRPTSSPTGQPVSCGSV